MHLVMLDANILLKDRHMKSPLLQQLRTLITTHPDKVRAAVTEVVIAETVAKHHRDTARHKQEFNTTFAATKNWVAKLLDSETVEAARTTLDEQSAGYEEQLRTKLAQIGFDILGYPDVSHAELVARAVQRTRPNKDETGDGYRDTLNWFSIMHQAGHLDPSDEVVWVTDDNDFADNDGLHTALSAELHERAIECPVRLMRTIDNAIDHVQEQVDPEHKDTERVRVKLESRSSKISSFIKDKILPKLEEEAVSARSLAMPLTARDVLITETAAPTGDPKLTVAGAVEGGGARVRAIWTVPVTITYTEASPDSQEVSEDAGEGDSVPVSKTTTKEVVVVVDVVTDREVTPQHGTIARVAATQDDPGREAWAAASLAPVLEQIQRVLAAMSPMHDIQRRQNELFRASMPKFDTSALVAKGGPLDQLGRVLDASRASMPKFDTSALVRKDGLLDQLGRAAAHRQGEISEPLKSDDGEPGSPGDPSVKPEDTDEDNDT